MPDDFETTALQRIITTAMCASMVKVMLKQGWTVKRVAQKIGAPISFIEDVLAKQKTFLVSDIEALAQARGITANRMIFNSMTPRPEMRPLFDAVRHQLDLSEAPDFAEARKVSKKRRSRTTKKAA